MLPDSLLSIEDVSKILNRSEVIVRRLINRQILPAIDVNAELGAKRASWMIDPRDLREFLDNRRSVRRPEEAPQVRRPIKPAKSFI